MKCNARLVLSKKTGKIVFSIPSNWSVEGYLSTLTPKRKSKLDLDNIQFGPATPPRTARAMQLHCPGSVIANRSS